MNCSIYDIYALFQHVLSQSAVLEEKRMFWASRTSFSGTTVEFSSSQSSYGWISVIRQMVALIPGTH